MSRTQEPPIRRSHHARARRDWLAAGIIALVIIFEWGMEYGFQDGQRLTDPVSYFGDAHVTAALVAAARRGDFLPFVSKNIPSLGAPFVAQWDDFPISEDVLYFFVGVLARPLGVFGAINVAFVTACVLAGLSLFFVCRRLHLARPGAVGASILYGLCMFVFARSTHHFSLIFFYFVPWLALVGLWASSRRGIPLRSARFSLAAVVMILTSWSVIYYLYFGAQLIALSVIARLARWGRSQWRSAAALATIALIGVLSVQADTLYRMAQDGRNLLVGIRAAQDVEVFALKPINFFTAGGNHRYGFGRAIAIAGARQTVTSGEAPSPYMGVVGGITFLSMIGFLIVRLARGKMGMPVSWVLLALWFTFFHVVGGSTSVLGLTGISALRSVNRASIFVLTYVLLFGAWAFGKITRRLPQPLQWALALVVGAWGAWEAIPTSGVPATIEPMHRIAASDRQLVAEAEKVLPPGTRVFSLPAMDFPEAPPVGGVDSYEMFRPYFFSNHLAFSHGDMKGRPHGAWKYKVSQLPVEQMFQELTQQGFSALYVNLKPYGGLSGLDRFTKAGATIIATASENDSAFLRLPP